MCHPCHECGQCRLPVPDVTFFCPRCNTVLSYANPTCPECGFSLPLPPGAAFDTGESVVANKGDSTQD